MSTIDPLGFPGGPAVGSGASQEAHAAARLALHRVLEFTNRTIHDVINDPVVKNEVAGYYKLDEFIRHVCCEHERGG